MAIELFAVGAVVSLLILALIWWFASWLADRDTKRIRKELGFEDDE